MRPETPLSINDKKFIVKGVFPKNQGCLSQNIKDVFPKIFLDFLKVCVLECSYSMDTGGEFMDGCDSTGRSMICGGRIKDRLAQLAMNFR